MPGTKNSTTKSAKAPAKEFKDHPTGTKIGVVESDKRDKTRRVVISYVAMHPKYGKYVRRRTILQVHDEKNQARTGDIVEVAQCRPMSKTKRWRLVRIVENRGELTAALQSAKTAGEVKV
jgi:small subunit ribosomal protein S17